MTALLQEHHRMLQRWIDNQQNPSWSVQDLEILEAAINDLQALVQEEINQS
jgi:hypothetical protein